MSQYTLPLAFPPSFSAYNFFVSVCNREAWEWVTRWPNWPAHALLIYGPAGSGKSHLSAIWATKAQATTDLATQGQQNLLVENIDRMDDDETLLHVFNATKENGHHLLMTSTKPPAMLGIALPDLRSRLLAANHAPIGLPDDDALAAVMRKQFSDRQMKVDDEVISYIIPRVERSLGKAKELVEKLDALALSEKKSITIPLAKRLIENLILADSGESPRAH